MQGRRIARRHDQANIVNGPQYRLRVIDLVERARIAAARRESGFHSQRVCRFDVELDHRRRRESGNGRLESALADRPHGRAAPGAAIGRPAHSARGHPIRVSGGNGDRHRFVGRGHHRGMTKSAERRAEVVFEPGILRAGRSVPIRNRERCHPCRAVEVKPRVQQIRAGEPFRAKGDLVFAAVHDGCPVRECRLRVVVHVFGRTVGGQVEYMIGRVVRINDDFAPMVSDDAPGRCPVFKRTVLYQFARRAVRRFNHAHVVEQDFTIVKQAQHKLAPQGRPVVLGRDGAVGVPLPRGLERFIAGGPGLGLCVVGKGISQFQARAAPVRVFRPAPAIIVTHLIDRVFVCVAEGDQFGVARQPVPEIADAGHARIQRAQVIGIAGHHQIGSGRHGRAGRENEIDAFVQLPAGQVHRVGAPIEKLDPGLGRRGARQVAGMIHDFIDDDLAVKRKPVGTAGVVGYSQRPLASGNRPRGDFFTTAASRRDRRLGG